MTRSGHVAVAPDRCGTTVGRHGHGRLGAFVSDWHRGLRLVAPLVSPTPGFWPYREIDAVGLREQTAVINSIRARLTEFSIDAPVGRRGVLGLLHAVPTRTTSGCQRSPARAFCAQCLIELELRHVRRTEHRTKHIPALTRTVVIEVFGRCKVLRSLAIQLRELIEFRSI